MGRQDVSDFAQYLSAIGAPLRRMWIRYIAIRNGEEFQPKYIFVGLTHEPLEEIPPISTIETRSLFVRSQIIEIDDSTISQICSSLLGSRDFREFPIWPDDLSWPTDFMSPTYFPIQHPTFSSTSPRTTDSLRSPGLRITLSDHTTTAPIDPETLALELRTHDPSYSNIEDVLTNFHIGRDIFDRTTYSHVDIVVASLFKLETYPQIADGQYITLEISSSERFDIEKLRIAIIGYTGSTFPYRTYIKPEVTKRHENAGTITFSAKLMVPEKTNAAQCIFNYGQTNIGSISVSDPIANFNVRLQADRALYGEESLEGLLFGKRDHFETGISLLLHLLNLSVMRYGDTDTLSDGPDMVCFSSVNHVYVVECTTGEPDHKGKLLKLHERHKRLIEMLAPTGVNPDLIQPVLVTKLRRENTTANWSTLRNYGIALVCEEDLKLLATRTHNPPTPNELFQMAKAAIPSEKKNDEPGFPF